MRDTPPRALPDLLADLAGDEALLRRLRRGEALFHIGDRAEALFVVERGRLRLLRYGLDGNLVVAGVLHAGMTLAEAALYSTGYHCEARAEVSSEVRSFRTAAIRSRLRAEPDLAEAFSRALAVQLQDARARLELRAIRRADDRILAALAIGLGPTGARSLAGFAGQLGLAPETLYRTLRRLSDEGRIVRRRDRIELP